MSDKKTTQFSIRLPMELYRKLRFIAADKNLSLNQTIIEALVEAREAYRISVPNELLTPPMPH